MNKTPLQLKLEAEIDRQNNKEWDKAVKKLRQFAKSLVGQDIIRWYSRDSFVLYRIGEFKELWTPSSGAYGQWDKRRWVQLLCTSYTLSAFFDGATLEENLSKKRITPVFLNNNRGVTLPIAKFKKISDSIGNYIKIGSIQPEYNSTLEIGQEAYESKDVDKVDQAIGNFVSFTYFAPRGLFDKIESIYHKHFIDVYNFRQELDGLQLTHLTL